MLSAGVQESFPRRLSRAAAVYRSEGGRFGCRPNYTYRPHGVSHKGAQLLFPFFRREGDPSPGRPTRSWRHRPPKACREVGDSEIAQGIAGVFSPPHKKPALLPPRRPCRQRLQSINSPAADTGKQEPAADHCAAAANAFHAGNNCLHCLSAAFPCHSQRRQIVLQASYPPIDKAGFFHRSQSQRTSREGGFVPPPQLHAHSARVFPVSERQFPHRSGVLLLNLLLPRFRFFKLGRKISDCGREPLHGGLRF